VNTLGERVFETLRSDLLDAFRNSGLASGVGLALAVLVGGRHSDGSLFKDGCLLDERAGDAAEFESEGHVGCI
jgi:hypothetical protein